MIGFTCKGLTDEGSSRTILFIMKALILSIWFLFDFICMCARFHWFLKSPESIFLFSDDPNACNFMWVPLNGKMDISSDSAAQFSIGLGLIIWAIMGICLTLLDLTMTLQSDREAARATSSSQTLSLESERGAEIPNKRKNNFKKTAKMLLLCVLRTVLSCQQSCVLLPLTAVSLDPISFPGPQDSVQAICFHKWAVVGIPYGVPMIIGGILGFMLAASFGSGACEADNKVVGVICGLLSLITFAGAANLLITGFGLIMFWLFAGLGIGIWFTFGYVHVLTDLALIKILAGPSTFVVESLSLLFEKSLGHYSSASTQLFSCPRILRGINSQSAEEDVAVFCRTIWDKLGPHIRGINSIPGVSKRTREKVGADSNVDSNSEKPSTAGSDENEPLPDQETIPPFQVWAYKRNRVEPDP